MHRALSTGTPAHRLTGAPAYRRTGPRSRSSVAVLRADVHPHALDLRVELERGFAHLAAEAALFVTAERGGRVEHVVAVDPHGAGFEYLGHAVGLLDVARPHRRGE